MIIIPNTRVKRPVNSAEGSSRKRSKPMISSRKEADDTFIVILVNGGVWKTLSGVDIVNKMFGKP